MERSEAFLIGAPLTEIAEALALSSKSEIVLAPSAAQLLTLEQAGASGWQVVELGDGHLRTTLTERAVGCVTRAPLRRISYGTIERADGRSDLLSKASNTSQDPMGGSASLSHRLVDKMQAISAIPPAGMFASPSPSSPRSRSTTIRRPPAKTRSELSNATVASSELIQALKPGDPVKMDCMGMGALLRFVPSFVKHSCLEGRGSTGLMEHRMVAILFCIADMKVHRSP